MRPSQSQLSQTVTIYKAPQKGKGQKLLKEGFQPVDFPDNPPYFDGKCYFAGTNDRSIAEEFNQSYKEGILEVSIERKAYNQYFKALPFGVFVDLGESSVKGLIKNWAIAELTTIIHHRK